MSARILQEARKQQSELQDEYAMGDEHYDEENRKKLPKKTTFVLNSSKIVKSCFSCCCFFNWQKQYLFQESDSDSDSDAELNHKRGGGVDDYLNEEIKINELDEAAFEMFMSNKSQARRTIADIIMEKLTEKKTELQSQFSENDESKSMANIQMDERVVKVYTQLKEVLQKYRSGKLPKAFKILPSLTNWEHILYLTEPDSWSAAAIYQATRIFASNLNARMAQRFYSLVLLPRIRDDINEYKRLNFHLYMALKKALFKPAAFFKGILLPLCESRNCTLREAIIIGSILAKNSIPMLHSAAALLKVAQMEYSGANSIFIRILLDKKYALPYRVIDAIVFHFLK